MRTLLRAYCLSIKKGLKTVEDQRFGRLKAEPRWNDVGFRETKIWKLRLAYKDTARQKKRQHPDPDYGREKKTLSFCLKRAGDRSHEGTISDKGGA